MKVKVLVAQLCPTLCNPMDYSQPGFSVHGDSPGKNTGVGCHALFQGIFPTQGLNSQQVLGLTSGFGITLLSRLLSLISRLLHEWPAAVWLPNAVLTMSSWPFPSSLCPSSVHTLLRLRSARTRVIFLHFSVLPTFLPTPALTAMCHLLPSLCLPFCLCPSVSLLSFLCVSFALIPQSLCLFQVYLTFEP